jgi:predicted Zn-dependent protease
MISHGASGAVRTRTAAEAAIHHLEAWWRHGGLDRRAAWSGDARFHLGRARRALDHGDFGMAEREATRALELDDVGPWALVVLGRCALAQHRPSDAVRALSRASSRAPRNRYVAALLGKAQAQTTAGVYESHSGVPFTGATRIADLDRLLGTRAATVTPFVRLAYRVRL